MQNHIKAQNIIKYQSYDKTKCLAQRQNVWMFSLFTMFKGSLLKICASRKKGPFPKILFNVW